MTLKSEFLGTLRIEVGETHFVEDTPAGWRRIDVFRGGTFKGPKIEASILSGGSAYECASQTTTAASATAISVSK